MRIVHVSRRLRQVLNECRGLYSIVSKRVKEAGDVVGIRSQDLRLSISRLRGTVKYTQVVCIHAPYFLDHQPLTTPPTSSPGANPPVAQVIIKGLPNLSCPSVTKASYPARETQMVQATFLRELEMNRDKVKAALNKLSDRGTSLVGLMPGWLQLY